LQVFRSHNPDAHVAVIGLGAGEIAFLTNLNKISTFYEIDPLMVNIAETNFKHTAQMPKPACDRRW
jgi:spermidine synthase